jgi:hypothetical protein
MTIIHCTRLYKATIVPQNLLVFCIDYFVLHGQLGLTKKPNNDVYICQKDESMHPTWVPTIYLIPIHMGGQKEYYLRVRDTKYNYL